MSRLKTYNWRQVTFLVHRGARTEKYIYEFEIVYYASISVYPHVIDIVILFSPVDMCPSLEALGRKRKTDLISCYLLIV